MKKNKLKKEVSESDGGAFRKFEFSLFSLKKTSVLKLESSTNENGNFVLGLLSIFAKDIDYLNRQLSIDALQRNTDASELPKVRMQMIPSFFSEYPSITVYIRKNNLKESPHIIGEFKFTHLVFVFVVPFSSRDEKQFVDDEGFNYFWERFHYSKGEMGSQWKTYELSSLEKRELVFNFNFQANKNL